MSTTATDLIDDLQWRGLLADCTDLAGLRARLATGKPITVYCGFDPTGDSLHVGHLMGQLTLARFQRAGHHVIALAGGATGMVGDPSGRSSERNLLTREQLAHNIACIKAQLSRLLDFTVAANPARLVDNADWIAPFSFLDFLRDVGKHFSLNVMLAKDSVKSRMEGDAGISYTEFSYQLLQAYDFYHLRRAFDCELQIGGSDQWGNLTAGTDLIRKKLGHESTAWGWTFPLITKSDGTKFGKTASGAVWLDATRTSPYKLYQFFVNTEDAKVCEYLRKFTFLSRAEIEILELNHQMSPSQRGAHKTLAQEVVKIVHGEEALAAVIRASEILFGGSLESVTEETFLDVAGEIPTVDLPRERLAAPGLPLTEALVLAALETSKGNARKSIEAGGAYVNNLKSDPAQPARALSEADLLFGKYVLLRKGKKSYAVLRVAA